MIARSCATSLLFAAALAVGLQAADSDPAKTPPPPAGSIGFADRSPDLDVLPGFRNPPPGFGIVPFYWWLGDTLTKERLAWQLEQMKGMGVSGYQINYAHSAKGGRSFGLTYPSDPAIFSQDWWELVDWFKDEAQQQGAGISLSDYTLGFGQGYMVDELLRDHPEVTGMELRMGKDGKVTEVTVPWSLNPMHPMSGTWYAERFFGQFEKQFPGQAGKGLNFFFSDELGFGVSGRLWSKEFAGEFRKRKGYDITPELAALFKDIGPRTPKVRMDYYDVLAALSEEGFFKPVFDWHQQRGMIMGCDHGGRGKRVDEFGDYFRTQRWNQGPGADQPRLGKDLIKAKVAASIAHLYDRPRVWLEGFYSSGWGTTSAGLVDATLANYAMGFNLLGLHGMYYSTHGGWWEWAPPDNTFRMPYWKHLRAFMDCQQRLAYLLSQGHYRCDVAILYPVSSVDAGMDGKKSVDTAFATANTIYGQGVDFDFMDFQSLDRAQIVGKELHVTGNVYKVLILPAMKALRHPTLRKALEFKRAGGLVLAVGAVPEASDRIGRDDPEVAAMVAELFPKGPIDQVKDIPTAIPFRDYVGPGFIQHRKIGPRDVYAIYDAPEGSECFFRATGHVELWDPWSGSTRPLEIISQDAGGTKLRLPLTAKEMQVIVFSPGKPVLASQSSGNAPTTTVALDGAWEFELAPKLDNRFGDFHWPPTKERIGPEARRMKYADETSANPGWEKPTLDDSAWRQVTCGFGPRFWKLGPLPATAEADAALASLKAVDPAIPVRIGNREYAWTPYEFSWRYGIEGDCGSQGYHGLKIQVGDELIGLGEVKHNHPACSRVAEKEGTRYYLWTSVPSTNAAEVPLAKGGLLPAKAWLNGKSIDVSSKTASLSPGANPLLLRYDKPGRGWYVFGSGSMQDDFQFSTATQWIWWPDDTEGVAKRYFRKEFNIASIPESARLHLTCDNGYTVHINGRQVGSGDDWKTIGRYDIAPTLKTGANLIEIEARNGGGDGALVAEIEISAAGASPTIIGTDASWGAAPKPNGTWTPAKVVSSYAGSLWVKHEQGPPRVDEATKSTQNDSSMPWNHDLTSRWHKDDKRMEFDIRPQTKQPAGWYRFTAPPGLRSMEIPCAQNLRVWVDGKPVEAVRYGDGWKVDLTKPARGQSLVAIRVDQARGQYGGAAFSGFIRLACGVGEFSTGDWSKAGVMETYSGGAWYRKTIAVSAAELASRLVLDLGNVVSSAEVIINGKPAGIRVAPPWTFDITALAKEGDNRIEILVCNTLSNHYVTVPTHYRGELNSGLLGPVKILGWSHP
jgi:hypothetical protein